MVATNRSMAMVWGLILGGSIGWLINGNHRRNLKNIVVHLLDRVESLEEHVKSLNLANSEQTILSDLKD